MNACASFTLLNLQGISAPVIKPDPLLVPMDDAAIEVFDALDDEMTFRLY